MSHVSVVAAVLIKDEKLLIARKASGTSNAGKWELPGGKIKPGESPQDALKRELKEELNIEVEVNAYFTENRHSYPSINICLIAWLCSFLSGSIHLKDHDKIAWVKKEELLNYEFSEADIPIIQQIQRGL